jgi:hypothetical protein
MGHRQDMTPEQRLEWDISNYTKRLEANKGSNFEYWNEKHHKLLNNGWDLYEFKRGTHIELVSNSEEIAKEVVEQLRSENNYARIVCGYIKNRQRNKTYSVIFKKKN